MTRAIDERRVAGIAAAVLSAVYWLSVFALSSRKLLWNDELYTYYVARLPAWRDVWHALLAGGEQTPPLFYAITRGSIALFGLNPTALRLPEMIAFWAMGACIAVFVSRRSSPLFGVAAGVLPLVSGTFYYATEARPYALVLAFAALALVAWQSLAMGRRRAVWWPVLVVALAAVVSCHYYGVFVVAALAAAEIVRTRVTRRLDALVWLAFVLAAVPLVPQAPLLRTGAAYASTFWSPPQWVDIPDFYYFLVSTMAVPLAAAAVCVGLYALLAPSERTADTPPPPVYETAALVALMAIPLATVLAAKVATGAFTNRYAMSAIVGLAAMLPLGARRAARDTTATALILVVCCGAWFSFEQLRDVFEQTQAPITAASVSGSIDAIRSAPDAQLPVAVADPHTFTVLYHYAPPDVRQRLVYLADPARALRRLRSNSVERGMLDLVGPWFGMPVRPYASFIDSHETFLVYGNFGALAFLNWLMPELQAEGFTRQLIAIDSDRVLLLVSHSRSSHERAGDTP